jgi:lipopolysaccharide transport system ATP-binding protein
VSEVRFDGVWKKFPRWQAGTRSVRSMLSSELRAQRRSTEERWALEDVSFELAEGRALGIIGHNGAGKSTLLRLASGLTEPTRGTIGVAPDAASVLSLGDTFDLELSGLENATTAAMVMGMRLSQANAALEEIIAFAELEEFQEAPMRSYSDGMKLRLAFGVVAQLSPRLLILDEVLAVGDLRFQEKCMQRIRELRAGGTSVLFASHSLEQVAQECDDVLWLANGRMQALGEAEDVVEQYRNSMEVATLRATPAPPPEDVAVLAALAEERDDDDDEEDDEHEGEGLDRLILQTNRFGSQEVQIEAVSITSPDGEPNTAAPEGTVDVGFTIRSAEVRDEVFVSVSIHRPEGSINAIDLNSDADEVRVGPVGPEGRRVTLSLDDLELAPGDYYVDVGVYPTDWGLSYDYHWRYYRLKVTGERYTDHVFRPRRRRWNVSGA